MLLHVSVILSTVGYDVTSCLVPRFFRGGMVPEGGGMVPGGVWPQRGGMVHPTPDPSGTDI